MYSIALVRIFEDLVQPARIGLDPAWLSGGKDVEMVSFQDDHRPERLREVHDGPIEIDVFLCQRREVASRLGADDQVLEQARQTQALPLENATGMCVLS